MWPSRAGDSATEGPHAPVPPAPLPASPAHPNKRPRLVGRGPRRGVGRAGAHSGARGRRGGGAHLRGGRGLRTRPGGPQRSARRWRAAAWPLRRGGRVDSGPGKTDLEKGRRRRRRRRQRRGGGSAREEGPRPRRAGERRKRGPGPRRRPGGPAARAGPAPSAPSPLPAAPSAGAPSTPRAHLGRLGSTLGFHPSYLSYAPMASTTFQTRKLRHRLHQP